MFAKLVRKTAKVLDPADPKKKVFQKSIKDEWKLGGGKKDDID